MNMHNLKVHLTEYLAMKAALGYKLRSEPTLLRGFVNFLENEGESDAITADQALRWACSSSTAGPAGRAFRLGKARVFLSYLQVLLPQTQVPGPGLLASVPRRAPYIYSEADITRLLNASLLLGKRGLVHRSDPGKLLRPHTYGTLIGLLASTGLRIGETIRLDREDVRLEEVPPHILVRETKFRKTRIVPVHPSVATKLHHYLDQRREFGYGGFTPAFFVSERGMRLSYHAILETWNILLESAGIHPTADGRRPTIHALRHSFAVGRLLEWQRNGADITANLPHLSVYLGHTEPKNTYWYLTATPELLGAAAVVFERYAGEGDIR